MSTAAPWRDRNELLRRARRRTLTSMLCVAVAVGVGVPLENRFIIGEKSGTHPHHHSSVLAAVIVLAVVVVVCGGLLYWMFRRSRNPDSAFAPMTMAGLPRNVRRAVNRNIRRGTPDADPDVAAIERETAQRLVKQTRFSLVVFGIALAGELVEAVTASTVGGHLFFAAATLLFLFVGPFTLWRARQARRYLALTEPGQREG